MLYRRPRGGRALTLGNVIDLDSFRNHRAARPFTVFYLNTHGSYREAIFRIPGARVVEIQNVETLSSSLLIYQPEAVVVERSLVWSDPFGMVSYLHESHSAPVVMLFDRGRPGRAEDVKRAYACGVSDTLFAPLCTQELAASLKILLQIQDNSLPLSS